MSNAAPHPTDSNYADFYRRSIDKRNSFWAEQAQLIEWQEPFEQVCDASQPPFANWFVAGMTNLCHNAVDRHLKDRAQQNALIFVSTETGEEQTYSFAELHAEVQRMAACLQALDVRQGDRVLIYMPMIPQAAFAMLACARIGAIHCVVFGGFASASLASRIDDAMPTVIVSADAGMRSGKVIAYKPLLDEAIRLAQHKPTKVLLVDRGIAAMAMTSGRDEDYAALRTQHLSSVVPCVWVASDQPSYVLYTSGTTGKPKGVQRDTGGYAVALAASMKHIFCGAAGETFFCTSDIGWVVGHSYIVYGPLIAGMATIMYEGLPTRPDAGIWWQLVEKYRVTVMFSAPTAVRVLKKHDEQLMRRYDLSSLRALFLAGEPLDEPTARWITQALDRPVIDNYWQTESGWPILTIANGVEAAPSKFGSPGVAMYGFDVRLINESTGQEVTEPNQKGVLAIAGPLPPGCLQTIWRDDERFVKTYWTDINRPASVASDVSNTSNISVPPAALLYNTFDWAVRDADGYYFILGRTDDVINVAGHRLGTREIEESISNHANVAEVAVVGVADALKGQVPIAFVVARDGAALMASSARLAFEGEIMKTVDLQLGALARPARVHFVTLLPKTRSGKMLRRAIQAVCEQRDPGDLTTMDDPAALEQIRECLAG